MTPYYYFLGICFVLAISMVLLGLKIEVPLNLRKKEISYISENQLLYESNNSIYFSMGICLTIFLIGLLSLLISIDVLTCMEVYQNKCILSNFNLNMFIFMIFLVFGVLFSFLGVEFFTKTEKITKIIIDRNDRKIDIKKNMIFDKEIFSYSLIDISSIVFYRFSVHNFYIYLLRKNGTSITIDDFENFNIMKIDKVIYNTAIENMIEISSFLDIPYELWI
jgi:hypothetical protein